MTGRAVAPLLLTLLLVLILPARALGNPAYAVRTGKACGECHMDPNGGGPLTAQGEHFLEQLKAQGLYRPMGGVRRLLRLFVGYLHLLTAILWFGTILYVHLLLKPAYAARGLPKGELWLGWISICVLAATGAFLAVERIASWGMLFHTRFGLLLLLKICLFLVMVCTALLVTFAIGPRLRNRGSGRPSGGRGDLTEEEIGHCDGKEGRPAYVAYAGKIYDVTGSRLWVEGRHMGKHPAGADLTAMLKQAPHGEDKVLAMPRVGSLRGPGGPAVPRPEIKVFYVFAYLNLALVFLIVLVIALWRWG